VRCATADTSECGCLFVRYYATADTVVGVVVFVCDVRLLTLSECGCAFVQCYATADTTVSVVV
jgi:hypothetical protein